MENNILIRDFQLSDISSLTDLTISLGYDTTVEQMAIRMKTILPLENYWTFVAVLNKNIIGYIGIIKNYFWEQDGHFIRVQSFIVNENYRRQGVGQKLIEYAEKFAIQINAKVIVLNCGNRDERKAAHEFYTKMCYISKSTGYIKTLD